MPLREVLHTLLSNNRMDARKELVELFLLEVAETGNGYNTSKYNYTVENYENYNIVLKRPGLLNKGFDFAVDINGVRFKNRHNNGFHVPSHNDIISILSQIKNEYAINDYNLIKTNILKLYNFEEPDLTSITNIKFKDYENHEHPIAIVLLAIKWLFIEQDITYWNWSGRNMLKNKLEELELL